MGLDLQGVSDWFECVSGWRRMLVPYLENVNPSSSKFFAS